MATMTRDEADLKLIWRVLTEELHTIKPWADEWSPRRYHWVLDADMVKMIERAATNVPWEATPPAGARTLVGYPVEVREGIQGVHLVEVIV